MATIHHGQLYQRDQVPPRSRHYDQGRFGRLLPTLDPFAFDLPDVRDALIELGKPGGPLDGLDAAPTPTPQPNLPDPWGAPAPAGDADAPAPPRNRDNPALPAGFTFLGQFIDHDVTFDPTSSLERQSDPEAIANFRVPTLELDSLYASGKAASPHLYDTDTNRDTFLLDPDFPRDLPRNSQNVALIGDPRNDENLIVSQLHLAFLRFHNAVVEQLRAEDVPAANLFADAQRLVRWHYQWIVVHEFLPHIVGQELVNDILEVEEDDAGDRDGDDTRKRARRKQGRLYYKWNNAPYIPVEFSVAAYRFGHSQIRPGYRVNASLAAPIFVPAPGGDDLSGGRRAAEPARVIDWRNFFAFGDNPDGMPLASKRIDTILSEPLFHLPFTGPNLPTNPAALAQRNLLRHLTFALPSGQDIAKAMRVADPLDADELADLGLFAEATPLWLYVLREADLRADGERLGPVGGRIVAEVLIGLLQGDRQSYLRQFPGWHPRFGSVEGTFGIADLLRFAGVAAPA